MKDDFVLKSGQGIRFNTYTSFKDPEKTRYDENDATKNEFKNTGRVTFIKHNQTFAKDQTSDWTFKADSFEGKL